MKNILPLFLLLFSLIASAKSGITLYVSPNGNDTQSGTPDRPLATLNQAWNIASAHAGKESITICLRQGTHYLSQPIVITGETSGTKKHPVRFCGYPNEKAVVSTSKTLKGLHWTPYKDGIMQAVVNEDLTFDQLFVNGQQCQMARYPNYDKSIHIFNGYAADALSPDRVAHWHNPIGGYIHAMHSREWGGYQYTIEGKDADGKLKLGGGFQNNRQMGMHPTYQMVENIFEELDMKDEWYFDKATHTLYYYPTQGIDLSKALIEVPQSESIFVFQGSREKPVSHVYISGLELTQTLRTFMKTDEPLLRSDWKIYRGAAVFFDHAESCTLSDCSLHHLGGNAIFFSNYNRNHLVEKNHITHIGASAVCFVGSPSAVRSPLFEYNESQSWETMDKGNGPLNDNYPSLCRVDNNLIHSIGEIEKQGAGIQISMSSHITVSHNSIYDLPRAGINISEGTWGGHLIDGNDVFNTVLETGDHGSFNSWGRDRFWYASRRQMDTFVEQHPEMILADAVATTVICNNRWRCDHGWDIDLDDGSSNYHIYNNLCLNGGLKLREGFARTVENNVMVNNSFHPHVWFNQSGDVFRHNIVTTAYRPIQVESWGKEIDFNCFPTTDALQAAQQNGTDTHSVVGNPLFVNPQQGDYRVKKGSPAIKAGFRNFAIDKFGVQHPKLKALAATPQLPEFVLLTDNTEKVQTHLWKGLTLKNVTSEGERSATGLDRIRGVLVLKVEGQCKTVEPNDVILQVNGKFTDTWVEMQTELTRAGNNATVLITILRNQKEMEVSYP